MIVKYPRTQHIQGSKLQSGDEDLSIVPYSFLKNKYLVLEEKLDGANSGVSFEDEIMSHDATPKEVSPKRKMMLQCRGHYLSGGPGEKQFELFKSWTSVIEYLIHDVFKDVFIMYGEWCYAKHTVFYDNLPHYFFEFDLYNKKERIFLSTEERRKILKDLPICSVPVLAEGKFNSFEQIQEYIKPSLYKTPDFKDTLSKVCLSNGLNLEMTMNQTDLSDKSEGLYIKWEEDGIVKGRYKLVREGFLQVITDSNTHWKSRPICPNQLAKGVDIFKV